MAVRHGRLELALELLKLGAKAVKGNKARTGSREEAQSRLRRALRCAVQTLSAHAAAAVLPPRASQAGVTPLHEAAKHAHSGALRVLLRAIPARQLPAVLAAQDMVRPTCGVVAGCTSR